ncbi:MAG: hypothetical protein L0206_00995 [Actinobacteria bacterium]|nr:hypothetical protein [Actinomycetota bacterium]
MTLTLRDRIALTKVLMRPAEREQLEALAYLIERFHRPAMTRDEALAMDLDLALAALKVLMPSFVEAMRGGDTIVREKLEKLH